MSGGQWRRCGGCRVPQIVSVQLLCYEELHISMACSPSMLGNVPSGPLLKDVVSQPEQTTHKSC